MLSADLHFHSTASDGYYPPEELIERGFDNGAQLLSLTDHDTLSGIAAAQKKALELEVDFVPGIELSCIWNNIGIHVVGLGFDLTDAQLLESVAGQCRRRNERAIEIGRRIDKTGIDGSYEKAKQIAGSAQIGRPHFARLLVETGKVKDCNQAFKKYLGAGKTGDVKALWPQVSEAIGWIQQAGGYAVLAHPNKYKLTRTRLNRLVTQFKEEGGDGLEVISGRQEAETTRHLVGLCRDLGLYASCGSDFHGPETRWLDIGKNQLLPDDCRPIWELWL